MWGGISVVSTGDEPPPPGTEERLGGFAELVGTAIANAASQVELRASRARVVATADETRRQIERDLHDGAQQRLISVALQRARRSGDGAGRAHQLDATLEEIVVRSKTCSRSCRRWRAAFTRRSCRGAGSLRP